MKKNIYTFGILYCWSSCFGSTISNPESLIQNQEFFTEETEELPLIKEIQNFAPEKLPSLAELQMKEILAPVENNKMSLVTETQKLSTFHPDLLNSFKISGIQNMLNNQNLLNLVDMDKESINFFLSFILPEGGLNILKPDTDVLVAVFENPQGEKCQCFVLQISENNQSFKDYMKKAKMSSCEYKGYTILSQDEEYCNRLFSETKFSQTVETLAEHFSGEGIELRFFRPEKLFGGELKSGSLTPNTEGKIVLQPAMELVRPLEKPVREASIALQPTLKGIDIRFAVDFNSTVSFYSKLQSANYDSFNMSKYFDLDGAFAAFYFQNMDWMIDAFLRPLISFVFQGQEIPLIEKVLNSLKSSFFKASIFALCNFEGKGISYGNSVISQNMVEEYLISNELMMTAIEEARKGMQGDIGKELLSQNLIFKHRFLCDYRGYKIHTYTLQSFNDEKSQNSAKDIIVAENSVKKIDSAEKEINAVTKYITSYDKNQVLESDSLDHLKLLIDHEVTKKIPAQNVESRLSRLSPGTLMDFEIDTGETIAYFSKFPGLEWLKKVDTRKGIAKANLSVKDGQLLLSVSLDYQSIDIMKLIGKAKIESEKDFNRMYKGIIQSKPGEEKQPKLIPVNKLGEEKKPAFVPISRSYILKSNFKCEMDRQILIPVKISLEYKAIG